MAVPKTANFLRSILNTTGPDDCELVLTRSVTGLTRFMANRIHQSTVTEERDLAIRVVRDGRAGSFITDRFDQDSIAFAIQRATEIAGSQPGPERPVSLPLEVPLSDSLSHDELTARAMPYDRAQILMRMIDLAAPRGVQLSGAVTTVSESVCVVNSHGTESFQSSTFAELNLLAAKGPLSGRSYWIGSCLGDMPFEVLACEAVGHADPGLPEITIPAEPATVILDHYAVGQLVGFLAYMGFGAKAFLEGRSFTSNRMGKKVCSSKVTIWDDGIDPDGLPRVFDSEGVGRKRVVLLEMGVVKNVVTDSATASQLGVPNTGHAQPPNDTDGPAAQNLFMAPGDRGLGEIVRRTRNGIYVRDFHYVNVVEPMTTMITGMTRDGTFQIRNGKRGNPVRNLRFTVNVLEVLKNIVAISSETRLVEGVCGPVCVPALKVRKFAFTGVSDQ